MFAFSYSMKDIFCDIFVQFLETDGGCLIVLNAVKFARFYFFLSLLLARVDLVEGVAAVSSFCSVSS